MSPVSVDLDVSGVPLTYNIVLVHKVRDHLREIKMWHVPITRVDSANM